MATTPKTKPTTISVSEYIQKLENETHRANCTALVEMMHAVTGAKPVLWGNSIIGFGEYHYQYKSGCEGDWPLTGFAARKNQLVVYIMPGFDDYADLLQKLGKHKLGKSCLYFKSLETIDPIILKQIIRDAVRVMTEKYTTKIG